jgi:hypothetical protein
MQQEQIDWILAQDSARLTHYRELVAEAYRPKYQKWGDQMGNSAWMQVLQGLCEKLSDCYSRAERMGFDYSLGLESIADLWLAQKGLCAVTGLIMTFESGTVQVRNPHRCSVDRINSNKGYTDGNIRLLTHWANNAYNTWDDKLFEKMIRASYAKLSA